MESVNWFIQIIKIRNNMIIVTIIVIIMIIISNFARLTPA